MSERFNRFVSEDHPEGFWKVSEQEMQCMLKYHGTEWLCDAINADVFFYVHDAWKDEQPAKVEYRPFFVDNLEVTYTPAKMPGFTGPMQTKVLKEGTQYKSVWEDPSRSKLFTKLAETMDKKAPPGTFQMCTVDEFASAIEKAGGLKSYVQQMSQNGFSAVGLMPDNWMELNSRNEEIPGAIYGMNGKTIIISSRPNGWYEQQFINRLKSLVEPNAKPKLSVGEAISNWLDSFVGRCPDKVQPDVPAKNKPKGPTRTKNQRGAWWNK